MSHTRKEIYSSNFGFDKTLLIPKITHTLEAGTPFFNFPKNLIPEDVEVMFLNGNGPLPDQAKDYNNRNFIFKNNLSVKVVDYNIGKEKNYAEIVIVNSNGALDLTSYDSSYVKGRTDNDPINAQGLGRIFVEHKYLKKTPGTLDLDFPRDIDTPEKYQNVLKEFKKNSRLINSPTLSYMDWEDSFILNVNASEDDWIYRESVSGMAGWGGNAQSDVFFSKKYAAWCVSVIISETLYENIDLLKKQMILNNGKNAIIDYLKCDLPDNHFWDIVKVFDINTDQTRSESKIKFLVGIPHRYIAHTIKKKGYTLQDSQAVQTFLKSDSKTFIGNAFQAIYDNLPEDVQQKLTDVNNGILVFDKGVVELSQNGFAELANAASKGIENPLLSMIVNSAIAGLVSSFQFSTPIDNSTPYVFINYSPNDKDKSKKNIDDLAKRLKEINTLYPKFLENHQVTPAFNFGVQISNLNRIFDSLYQYSLDKIISKESIDASTAERKLVGTAIYFNIPWHFGDDNDANSFAINDLPETMDVIGIDIIYLKSEDADVNAEDNRKVISLKDTEKNDYLSVMDLSDKTLLYLMLHIHNITSFKVQDGQNLVEEFLNAFVFPPRDIVFIPTLGGDNDNLECLANVAKSLGKQAKELYLNPIKKSIYHSTENISKSVFSKQAYLESMDNISKDLKNTFGDNLSEVLFNLLGNIDFASIIMTIIECLRKKGVPVDELMALYNLIVDLIGAWGELLCLIPPLTLPKIPALDLNFEVHSIDILGAVYKALKKAVIELINATIQQFIIFLLDSVLGCPDLVDQNAGYKKLFPEAFQPNTTADSGGTPTGAGGTPDMGSGGQALTADGGTGQSGQSSTTTSTTTDYYTETYFTPSKSFSSVSFKKLTDDKSIMETVFPNIKYQKGTEKPLLEETKGVIKFVSENLTSWQFLNLLAGKASKQDYWFIKDVVSVDPKFPVLKASGNFDRRENFDIYFKSIGDLLDQEIMSDIRQTTTTMITNVNALCLDNSTVNLNEAAFLASKYGNENVEAIKKKFVRTELKTIKTLENFLRGKPFTAPPIRSIINPDGTTTKGLMQDEPHSSQIHNTEQQFNKKFEALKKTFNKELTTIKYAYLSTVSVKLVDPNYFMNNEKLIKRMNPGISNEDLNTKKNQGYYKNTLVVNSLFSDSLKDKNKYFKPDESQIVYFLTPPLPNLDDIKKLTSSDSAENPDAVLREQMSKQKVKFNGKEILLSDAIKTIGEQISVASSNFTDGLFLKKNFLESELSTRCVITIQNSKLFPEIDIYGKETGFRGNKVAIVSEKKISDATKSLIDKLNDDTFGDDEPDDAKRLFLKLLFRNNVIINTRIRREIDIPRDFNYRAARDLYSDIYDKIKAKNEKTIKDSILNSPLANIEEGKRPAILDLPLEADQPDFCNDDIHLLQLKQEAKEIVEYYTKNNIFNKPKPYDGSISENLNAKEYASLRGHINIFFRIFVYDYYLRAIPMFGAYLPTELDNRAMEDFLTYLSYTDKYVNKLYILTKNGKFIRRVYETDTKNKNSSLEDAYRYFIRKNMKIVSKMISKKLLKSGLRVGKQGILDDVFNGAQIINVEDRKKIIYFDNNSAIEKQFNGYIKILKEGFNKYKDTVISDQTKLLDSILQYSKNITIAARDFGSLAGVNKRTSNARLIKKDIAYLNRIFALPFEEYGISYFVKDQYEDTYLSINDYLNIMSYMEFNGLLNGLEPNYGKTADLVQSMFDPNIKVWSFTQEYPDFPGLDDIYINQPQPDYKYTPYQIMYNAYSAVNLGKTNDTKAKYKFAYLFSNKFHNTYITRDVKVSFYHLIKQVIKEIPEFKSNSLSTGDFILPPVITRHLIDSNTREILRAHFVEKVDSFKKELSSYSLDVSDLDYDIFSLKQFLTNQQKDDLKQDKEIKLSIDQIDSIRFRMKEFYNGRKFLNLKQELDSAYLSFHSQATKKITPFHYIDNIEDLRKILINRASTEEKKDVFRNGSESFLRSTASALLYYQMSIFKPFGFSENLLFSFTEKLLQNSNSYRENFKKAKKELESKGITPVKYFDNNFELYSGLLLQHSIYFQNIFNLSQFDINLGRDDVLMTKIRRIDPELGEKFYIGAITRYEDYSSAELFINNESIYTYQDISTGKKYILSVFSKVNLDSNLRIDRTDDITKDLVSVYEDMFNPGIEFLFLTMACMCQNTLIKDVDRIFNNSKIMVLKTIEYMIFNNHDYSSKDDALNDYSFQLLTFIKGLLAIPVVLIKGVAEAIDPNIGFTSKISLAVKVAKKFIEMMPAVGDFKPKEVAKAIPTIHTPILAIPLGFAFPFIFTPMTIAYIIMYDWSDQEDQTMTRLSDLGDGAFDDDGSGSSSSDQNKTNVCDVDPILPGEDLNKDNNTNDNLNGDNSNIITNPSSIGLSDIPVDPYETAIYQYNPFNNSWERMFVADSVTDLQVPATNRDAVRQTQDNLYKKFLVEPPPPEYTRSLYE